MSLVYGQVLSGCQQLASHLYIHPDLPSLLLYPLADAAAARMAGGLVTQTGQASQNGIVTAAGGRAVVAVFGRDKSMLLDDVDVQATFRVSAHGPSGTGNVINCGLQSGGVWKSAADVTLGTQRVSRTARVIVGGNQADTGSGYLRPAAPFTLGGITGRHVMGVVSDAEFGILYGNLNVLSNGTFYVAANGLGQSRGYAGRLCDLGTFGALLKDYKPIMMQAADGEIATALSGAVDAAISSVIGTMHLRVPVGLTWDGAGEVPKLGFMSLRRGCPIGTPAYTVTTVNSIANTNGLALTQLQQLSALDQDIWAPTDALPQLTGSVQVSQFDVASAPTWVLDLATKLATGLAVDMSTGKLRRLGVADFANATSGAPTFASAIDVYFDSSEDIEDKLKQDVLAQGLSSGMAMPTLETAATGWLNVAQQYGSTRWYGTVPAFLQWIQAVYSDAKSRLS